jgi:hypothetical protein
VVAVLGGGNAPVLRKGREVAVVVRDEAGSGAGLLIAGARRFDGEIFVPSDALAGPWWPVGIPVAGRRDGSGRGQLGRPRSSGGSRWVLSCPSVPCFEMEGRRQGGW